MLRVSGIAEPASIPRYVPVAAELLIEIQGDNFAYAGEAISANAHQALIRTSAPLRVAAQVTIHVAGTGRSVTGRVVSERHELSYFVVEFASETLRESGEGSERARTMHLGASVFLPKLGVGGELGCEVSISCVM